MHGSGDLGRPSASSRVPEMQPRTVPRMTEGFSPGRNANVPVRSGILSLTVYRNVLSDLFLRPVLVTDGSVQGSHRNWGEG